MSSSVPPSYAPDVASIALDLAAELVVPDDKDEDDEDDEVEDDDEVEGQRSRCTVVAGSKLSTSA